MRIARISILLPLLGVLGAIPAPDRDVTDPRSIASPDAADARPVPPEDLFFSTSYSGAAWSPDGREIVISSNLTGRFNLWRIPSAGGWPVQLTRSEDRQTGASWSPDGQWIVFESDREGGEIFDMFAVPSAGGETIDVTDTPDVSETDYLWSPDGAVVAMSAKPKGSPTTDIALLDWKTRRSRTLTREATKDHGWQAFAWSRDGRYLFANRYNAGFTDADVYRLEVSSGRSERLTRHAGEALVVGTDASADGRMIAVTSNERNGQNQAGILDRATGRTRWLGDSPWEQRSGGFSPDGESLAYLVNIDGRSDLYLYRIASGTSAKLPLPDGLNAFAGRPSSFSPRGDRLLVSHQSSTEPADYWTLDPRSGEKTTLTRSAVASLSPDRLPSSRLVHYRSFDGTVISAFLWMPFGLARDGRHPGIVLPHGGPTGQTLDTFHRTAIALASRGYVCIAPNVRGSTGYGKAFQKANYQDLGGGDLQDEVFGAKFLVATGYVDPKKIGITGGSYGGYMALIAIGRAPDAWAAAVDLYGVTDWLSEQEHEEAELQQYDQSILGDPVKDRAAYVKASPTTYFHQAKAPLLVLQGEKDIRDPKEEAERAFVTLREKGNVVEVHYYPDEGHGFAKRENQIDALRRTIAWFERYLR